MMPPLHILIKRVLLAGIARPPAQPIAAPVPPACLQPLVAACKPTHERFNARAVAFGNRYRSAFWAIYMLSAFAALCATLPAALGWDQSSSAWHSYAGLWGVAEVLVIASVGVVYWRGHKEHWQEQWLAARTNAELAWYLPLVAPLVDFTRRHSVPGWYARLFDPGAHLREANDIDQLCAQLEPEAVNAQEALWGDPAAVRGYAGWACAIMEEQRQYHRRVGAEQHQLLHRVHKISTCLFALTALGAALHLLVHSLWLSMVTVFFPALGAALHGALAQSEAFRMEQNSARLVHSLGQAVRDIKLAVAADDGMQESVADAVQGAVALILEEHQDWHGTVRPHHIPLA